jgi:hypothetical protein
MIGTITLSVAQTVQFGSEHGRAALREAFPEHGPDTLVLGHHRRVVGRLGSNPTEKQLADAARVTPVQAAPAQQAVIEAAPPAIIYTDKQLGEVAKVRAELEAAQRRMAELAKTEAPPAPDAPSTESYVENEEAFAADIAVALGAVMAPYFERLERKLDTLASGFVASTARPVEPLPLMPVLPSEG